jgi:hypothetical protein
MCKNYWLESLKGKNYSGDLDEGRRIILKWILGKYVGRM